MVAHGGRHAVLPRILRSVSALGGAVEVVFMHELPDDWSSSTSLEAVARQTVAARVVFGEGGAPSATAVPLWLVREDGTGEQQRETIAEKDGFCDASAARE